MGFICIVRTCTQSMQERLSYTFLLYTFILVIESKHTTLHNSQISYPNCSNAQERKHMLSHLTCMIEHYNVWYLEI